MRRVKLKFKIPRAPKAIWSGKAITRNGNIPKPPPKETFCLAEAVKAFEKRQRAKERKMDVAVNRTRIKLIARANARRERKEHDRTVAH